MSADDTELRRAAWSSYWAGGGLHSCVGSYAGNYDGAVGDFWRAEASRLPDGARVLDLATGNGALPALFWEARGARALEVDAVDLAQVAPRWHRAGVHDTLRFHSGVALEQLPFADSAFDLVASQFGFEYADRGPALAELLRVASPRGRIALVMHHVGSVLVAVGRSELDAQRRLLAEGGLLRAAEAVVPWLAAVRAGEDVSRRPEATAAREAYNAAMRAVGAAISASRAPDLLIESRERTQRLLATTGSDPAPVLAAIGQWRQELRQGSLRTAELIGHALTPGDADALVAAIRAARPDHEVRCAALSQGQGVIGWALVASPSG